MTTYRVQSIGGRLLVQSPNRRAAYRMAKEIANRGGRYVEIHTPAGHRYFIYPAAA